MLHHTTPCTKVRGFCLCFFGAERLPSFVCTAFRREASPPCRYRESRVRPHTAKQSARFLNYTQTRQFNARFRLFNIVFGGHRHFTDASEDNEKRRFVTGQGGVYFAFGCPLRLRDGCRLCGFADYFSRASPTDKTSFSSISMG